MSLASAATRHEAAVPDDAVKPDKSGVAFFQRPKALAAARVSSTPMPLIVMLSRNPWLMVIGSDSPEFALYSDGTVIYRTKKDILSSKLDRSQIDRFVSDFTTSDLSEWYGYYHATYSSDQPSNDLLIYAIKSPIFITVYGSLSNEVVRAKLPIRVKAAFDRLKAFSDPHAKPWLPDRVEAIVSPYENSIGQSIVWPKSWPALNDRTTVKRGDSYSIFIPSADLPKLQAFLAGLKERSAVEIGGKKWAVSIRLPFPQETLRMPPNNEVAASE